ncbi:MAG TPA: VWA domain-containing protein, partial [Myxococcota bacterium]|nr:VWA domain-containing protein [Myxococcota bacterium]
SWSWACSFCCLAPSAAATLNQDFILSFSTADEQRAASRAWTDGQYTALFVEAPAVAQMPALPRDAVFVVDISGSMDGGKMEAAKKALVTALHGLLPGDRFRLIAFDDRVEAMSPDFLTYTNESLVKADAWVARLQPRGGTQMLPAIQAALDGTTPAGRLRTVLFITDGQAGDEDRLAAAVSNRRNGARFFTLGIDTAVNGALMKQLARLGGGTCELCTPTDDIEAVVAKLESRFGSPLLTGITAHGAVAARPEEAILFSGRPLSMLLEGGGPAQLTGLQAGGSWSETVVPRRVASALGPLWARERIAWLQDRLALRPFEEEAIKPEILRISLQHGVLSRFTAMVAVDRSVQVQGAAIPVVQPVELPAGWSEGFAEGGPGGGGMPLPQRMITQSAMMAPGAPPPRRMRTAAPQAVADSEAPVAMSLPHAASPRGAAGRTTPASVPMEEKVDMPDMGDFPSAMPAPAPKTGGIFDRLRNSFGLGGKAAKVAPAEKEESSKKVALPPPAPPSAPPP